MEAAGWRELREGWERLQWARTHCTGFARPTDAARALGLRPGTYRTYEIPKADGGRAPKLAELQRIARRFGVSWVWLATGAGAPRAADVAAPALGGRLAALLAQLPPERQAAALRAMEALLDGFARDRAPTNARRKALPGTS